MKRSTIKWPFKRHTEQLYVLDKRNGHQEAMNQETAVLRASNSDTCCSSNGNGREKGCAKEETVQDGRIESLRDVSNAISLSTPSATTLDEFISKNDLTHYEKMVHLLHRAAKAGITTNNQVTVLTDGSITFNAALQAMESAKQHIHFQMYIFHADNIGRRVIDLMKRKVQEGVQVRVIVDALGGLSSSAKKNLTKAGVQVATWFPLRGKNLKMKRLQFRNHRKIIVVDGQTGFMGGLNWSDMYDETSEPHVGWRDTFVRIDGDAVKQLQAIFVDDFEFAMGTRITHETNIEDSKLYPAQYSGNLSGSSLPGMPIQIVAGGPDSEWRFTHQLFYTAMSSARSSLFICTPYVAFDDSIMMALKTASLSGVDVHLIFQGRIEKRNVMTYLCGRGHLDELLKYGVTVHQYQAGIYHSKAIIVDHKWAIVNSANIDFRSYDSCFEVSAVIYDEQVARRLEEDFWKDVNRSRKVTMAERKRTNKVVKVAEYFFKQVSPNFKL